ncbi:hypothetical protein pb186bvf_009456 [Paramecium bursaria]
MFSFENLRCQIQDHKQKDINEVCLQQNCLQPRTICYYCKQLHENHQNKIFAIDHLEELLKNFQPQDKTQKIKNEIGNYFKEANILLDTLQLDIIKQFEQFDNPIDILKNQEPINLEDLNKICNQIIPMVTVENQKVKFLSNDGQINEIRKICIQELSRLLENIQLIKQSVQMLLAKKNQSQFRFKEIELQNIEYIGNIAKLRHKLVYSQLLLIEPELQEVKINNIVEIRLKILQNDQFCSFGISTNEQQNMMSSSRSLTKSSSIFTGNSRIYYMIKSDGKIISSDLKYNGQDIGFKIQKGDLLRIILNYQEKTIEFGKNNDKNTQLKNIQIDDHLYGAVALKEIGDSVQIL